MCNWYEIKIEPRDVLFFRGGKPMGATAIGEGAQWPMPSVFHQALLSAFRERWPEREMLGEHKHDARDSDKNPNSTFRFGGLQTVGVFPSIGNTLYFPMPSDVQCFDDTEKLCVLSPGDFAGKSDLPEPLKKGLFNPGKATKKKPKPWISFQAMESYLDAEMENVKTLESAELFDVESRPGIGLDAETLSTEDGKFYIAEMLRLRDGVSLKGFAACEQSRAKDEKASDVFSGYFSKNKNSEFIFGGQRGVAYLEGVRNGKLPTLGKPAGKRIKWVLLTPAIFTGGWLPSWVTAEGQVVRYEKPERTPRETRKEWRERIAREQTGTLLGTLVAACIPKPIPVSGWRVHGGKEGGEGARPTRLCVPAGAVYYFDVPAGADPALLLNFLNGKRKSDIGAEKGFGFGLCGVWKEFKKEGEQ